MGNTEAMPDSKLTSSPGKGTELASDRENLAGRDHDITENTVECKSETNDEDNEKTLDSSSEADCTSPKRLSPNPATLSNSASANDEENARLWQEAALKYQQIVYKEYKMLNLPIYPLERGEVYFYYVPVVVNGDSTLQNPSVASERFKSAEKSDDKVVEIVCIDEDEMSDISDGSGAQSDEEIKTVQRFPQDGDAKDCSEETGVNGCAASSPSMEPDLTTIGECPEEDPKMEQLGQATAKAESSDGNSDKMEENETGKEHKQIQYFQDSNLQTREGFIRVFKGHTIEYHPLVQAPKMTYPNTSNDPFQSSERDEKIRDLKTILAKQEEELEKLKHHQYSMPDVSWKLDTKGVNQREYSYKKVAGESAKRSKRVSSALCTGGKVFTPVTDCLPHQNRFSSRVLVREESNKQESPLISNKDVEKETVNFMKKGRKAKNIANDAYNPSARKKRKLASSNVKNVKAKKGSESELQPKRTKSLSSKCPRKTKKQTGTRAKGKKLQVNGEVSKEPELKGSELWLKKIREKIEHQACTKEAATLAHSMISQDEFLSMIGLVRKCENQTSACSELIIID